MAHGGAVGSEVRAEGETSIGGKEVAGRPDEARSEEGVGEDGEGHRDEEHDGTDEVAPGCEMGGGAGGAGVADVALVSVLASASWTSAHVVSSLPADDVGECLVRVPAEEDEFDEFEGGGCCRVLGHCVEHDAGALAKGETADTGAEGGKGD